MTPSQLLVRLPIVTCLQFLYGAGWHAGDDGAWRHVLRHDRTCADDRALADCHTGTDRHPRAQPHLVPDFDWLWDHAAALFGVWVMVERRNYGLRANQHIIADFDASLILKLASGVDEHAFADLRVLAAVIASPDRHQLGPPRLVSALHYKRELRSFAAL